MNTLADYAIKAFHTGSDKFGETPTGTCELYYNTMKLFGGQDPHYTMTVILKQADGHPCTSSIGFYKKNNILIPCSGHMLPWTIDITPEIQKELNDAINIEY